MPVIMDDPYVVCTCREMTVKVHAVDRKAEIERNGGHRIELDTKCLEHYLDT